jgi:hypothetical protein
MNGGKWRGNGPKIMICRKKTHGDEKPVEKLIFHYCIEKGTILA